MSDFNWRQLPSSEWPQEVERRRAGRRKKKPRPVVPSVFGPLSAVANELAPAANAVIKDVVSTPSMARYRNRRRRQVRRRRRERNGYFAVSRIPVKHVYLWADTKGTSGKWYINIMLRKIVGSFVTSYDEFKVSRLRAVYRPNNSVSDTGLYCGVLLDGTGFGAYGSASETEWFRTLASFPGSKVRPRHITSSYVWYPTEPSDREWFSYQQDSDKSVATLYFADNGKETVELGGVIEIFATVLARGLYYNATVKNLATKVKVRELLSLPSLQTDVMSVAYTPHSPDLDTSPIGECSYVHLN